jgi:hypothetical protein
VFVCVCGVCVCVCVCVYLCVTHTCTHTCTHTHTHTRTHTGGTWLKGTAARAADADEDEVETPKAKATATPKAPPPPKPAPAAPTNDYSRAMSDPEDPMGLGIFGCKFWGLQAKKNSASCEVCVCMCVCFRTERERGGRERGGWIDARMKYFYPFVSYIHMHV